MRFDEAVHTLALDGHRPDLVGLLEVALKDKEWADIETRFAPLVTRFPAYRQAIRAIYYKLREEWEQLTKIVM